jgi:hypothetical protein
MRRSWPGGDQPDDRIIFPVTVTDDKASSLKAVTQEQESFFFRRVIRIVDQASVLIEKDCLSFLKGDAMLGNVGAGLARSQANSILPTALY